MLVKLTEDGLNANHRRRSEEVLLHDRINEAYRGELGEGFQKKTKKRVDWVISNVKGKNVLDVGCSQGIVPILLAKKKVNITGIDIDQKVIDDAISDLKAEKDIRGHVEFICDDFMKYQPRVKYDAVIFTELLEHLYNPDEFISRAFELTEEGGGIVITSPFGINDHPDHRQNFYLIELYGLVSQYYMIEEVSILEKWIGFVGKRRKQKVGKELPSRELLVAAEESFYGIERNLTNRTYELIDKVHELNEELGTVNKDLRETKKYTRELWRKSHRLSQEKLATQKSKSYKIGRAATYAPRKLYAQKHINMASKHAYYTVFPGRRKIINSSSLHYKDLFKPTNPSKFYFNATKKKENFPRIAAIMDDFTYSSFKHEAHITQLTPENWKTEITLSNPDLLFIESAWRGVDGAWTNKIAQVPEELRAIVEHCRKHGVPTMFWNKEDPVHLAHFMKAASLFDFVFTSDMDSIPLYKDILGHDRVYLLPFAAQPVFNNPIEKYERKDKFNFAGSYYRDYKERCKDFDEIMDAVLSFKPVDIFDRNYDKNLPPKYQFPDRYKDLIKGTLPYSEIDKAYKGYKYAITMNTIKYSSTMFARRAFELLASNTITVGNYSKGMKYFLGDLTTSADTKEEIVDSLKNITKSSELSEEKYKLLGLRRVMQQHTYEERLDRILSKIFTDFEKSSENKQVAVVSLVSTQDQLKKAFKNYDRQDYKDKELVIILANDNVKITSRIADNAMVVKDSEKKKIEKLINAAPYISVFSPDAFYGKFYLTDLVLATQYSDADVIGKATYFTIRAKKPVVKDGKNEYREQIGVEISRSLMKSSLLTGSVAGLVKNIRSKKMYKKSTLSVDGFNYCDSNNLSSSDIKHIEGYLEVNLGADIHDVYDEADAISANKLETTKTKLRKKLRLHKTYSLKNNPKEV